MIRPNCLIIIANLYHKNYPSISLKGIMLKFVFIWEICCFHELYLTLSLYV